MHGVKATNSLSWVTVPLSPHPFSGEEKKKWPVSSVFWLTSPVSHRNNKQLTSLPTLKRAEKVRSNVGEAAPSLLSCSFLPVSPPHQRQQGVKLKSQPISTRFSAAYRYCRLAAKKEHNTCSNGDLTPSQPRRSQQSEKRIVISQARRR